MKRLINQLIAKAGAKGSGAATLSVAGILVGLGVWIEAHPDIIYLIPMEYQGIALVVIGAVVGAARMRSKWMKDPVSPPPQTDQAPPPPPQEP